MARYVDVNEVLRFAQEVFDTDPGPGSMQLILQAMYDTLTQVAQLRADLGDVTEPPWWAARSWLPGLAPEFAQEAAEDRARLMKAWDERANKFWARFERYDAITTAAQAGEFTGQFTANVVQPVLHGEASASPSREAWAEVALPDVIEPFRLWNELNQYLVGTDVGVRFGDWAQSVVERFGQSVKAKAIEGVEGLTQAAIDKIKEEADVYVNEARQMLKEEAEEAQAKVEAGIGIAIGLGLLALGITVAVVRRKKR